MERLQTLKPLPLKRIYPRGKNVLITLDERLGRRVKQQIDQLDSLGFDECILIESKSDRFDTLIAELKGMQFKEVALELTCAREVPRIAKSSSILLLPSSLSQ